MVAGGIGDYTTLSGWLGQTDTPGLNGDDYAYNVRLSYTSPNWFNTIGFTEVSEDFNPEVGFLARDDFRKFDARLFYVYRPEDLWGLLELRPHVSYRGFWDLDGVQGVRFPACGQSLGVAVERRDSHRGELHLRASEGAVPAGTPVSPCRSVSMTTRKCSWSFSRTRARTFLAR